VYSRRVGTVCLRGALRGPAVRGPAALPAALAFPTASRGEALKAVEQGSETLTVKRVHENPADTERLMEEVCERENCLQALRRVKRNKGAPGRTG